ncbi:MAG TPA: PilZ domain-containing protein [Thermodesulfobacteriota bacterium]|nr:PilZ domain-containing protein [Thermodesulfobacteriota bacterium]
MDKVNKKRASRRLPYQNEIELIGNAGQYCRDTLINISETGVCISTDIDIPAGTETISRFLVDSEKLCELEGRVAWCTKNQDNKTFRIGIELVKTPDDFNEVYESIGKKFGL